MVDYSLSNNKIIGMIQYNPNNEIYMMLVVMEKLQHLMKTPDKRYFINLEGKIVLKIIQS